VERNLEAIARMQKRFVLNALTLIDQTYSRGTSILPAGKVKTLRLELLFVGVAKHDNPG
jgi:hypothetical protein